MGLDLTGLETTTSASLSAALTYLLSHKAEFETSKVEVAQSTTLQTDNGSEYTSRAFRSFLAGRGITHRLSIPYTPEQNGLSEQAIRTVEEKVATLLTEADFSKKYRAEVFFFSFFALFIIENLPYSALASTAASRASKFRPADKCGTNRMLWLRNISFASRDYVPQMRDANDDEEHVQAKFQFFSPDNVPAGAAIALINAVEPSDIDDTQFEILSVPQTTLVTKKIYSAQWEEGMKEEWTGYQQQDVVLGTTHWHHTACNDPKAKTAQLKSMLVVQGVNAQVATAGDTVFVKQPRGFEVPGHEDYVYELKRAAYGLLQLGRAFHLKVKDKLDQLDFVSLSDGVALYIGRRGGDYVVLVIYVDDGLIAGKKALVEDVVGELQEDFDVTFGGPVDGKSFLGHDMKHDPQTGSVRVSIKSQIEKALKMHGFKNLKPLHMPIQPGIVYVKWDGEAIKPSEYLSAVGSLLFIAITRVDIQSLSAS
ncbi:retrotransposon [Rhodotorula toruloides NP11]|uniref:Retrotransposon n=1 Tax=Rhodotorula toruloides (strain NP11) TaxID=1130832 RepID=M7XAX1_RHOT1|nr:retrotransposon [Rhodotorula toruloides NP11]EMS20899.1 retrotransposon [Rhodotorula toruloides NP11]